MFLMFFVFILFQVFVLLLFLYTLFTFLKCCEHVLLNEDFKKKNCVQVY